MSGNLELSPLLPLPVIVFFAVLSVSLCLMVLWRSSAGALWRLISTFAITFMLLNPEIVKEKRKSQTDVVALIIDRTSSQGIGDRIGQTNAAVRHIRDRLGLIPNIDVREVNVTDTSAKGELGAREGSLLLHALWQILGTIPKSRIAGAIVVSDGQAHDEDLLDRAWGLDAPVHVLLTGQPDEVDRRLVIERFPSYGIVGKDAAITYRIEDQTGPRGTGIEKLAFVSLKNGNEFLAKSQVQIGQRYTFPIRLSHAGPQVFTLEVEATPNELSTINNRSLVTINGVRERLRVLLVSGQPHAGERVWRNLLKSDPAVDLVHFTILRPPEKDDFTPLNEISLISFPTRELFEEKIKEFDLVVFDRYVVRDVLPPSYFRNIVRYVREGGALLLAVGPEFATERSLYNTPLGEVLPAVPTGNVIERGFRPSITEIGLRHPVTAMLLKAQDSITKRGAGAWGRWFRQIEAAPKTGHPLMKGYRNIPLLVLDRIGDGRVASILSDQIWLWARGFEGGGPHAELMRRLAHWLMQEPDLEEEQLRAYVSEGKLHVNRRSLHHSRSKITVTTPTGATETYPLSINKSGWADLTLSATETGLYRISDGDLNTVATAGGLNPIEFRDLRATPSILFKLTNATGGGMHWIGKGLPDLRKVRLDRDKSGKGWIGLIDNKAYVVTGLTETSLVPPLLFVMGILAMLMVAWWKEGRS